MIIVWSSGWRVHFQCWMNAEFVLHLIWVWFAMKFAFTSSHACHDMGTCAMCTANARTLLVLTMHQLTLIGMAVHFVCKSRFILHWFFKSRRVSYIRRFIRPKLPGSWLLVTFLWQSDQCYNPEITNFWIVNWSFKLKKKFINL